MRPIGRYVVDELVTINGNFPHIYLGEGEFQGIFKCERLNSAVLNCGTSIFQNGFFIKNTSLGIFDGESLISVHTFECEHMIVNKFNLSSVQLKSLAIYNSSINSFFGDWAIIRGKFSLLSTDFWENFFFGSAFIKEEVYLQASFHKDFQCGRLISGSKIVCTTSNFFGKFLMGKSQIFDNFLCCAAKFKKGIFLDESTVWGDFNRGIAELNEFHCASLNIKGKLI